MSVSFRFVKLREISSKVQEAESWQAFVIHTTDSITACTLRDNRLCYLPVPSFCAVSWDVEGTCRGDGKGVCCDRQSKVEWRDNCLRWALSRQVRQREPIITLWCCVLSSPCIQNVPYSKPSQIRMWNSAECLQLEVELTFICTQLAFNTQEWGFISAQSCIFFFKLPFQSVATNKSTCLCGNKVKLCGRGPSLVVYRETKTEDWEGETETKKGAESEIERPQSIGESNKWNE